MTIAAVTPYIRYTTITLSAYNIPFPVESATDLDMKVYSDTGVDVTSQFTLTTSLNRANVGDPLFSINTVTVSRGTISQINFDAGTFELVIQRTTTVDQDNDFLVGADPNDLTEDGLDYITRVAQELKTRTDNSITIAKSNGSSTQSRIDITRNTSIIYFDGSGDLKLVTAQDSEASSFVVTALAASGISLPLSLTTFNSLAAPVSIDGNEQFYVIEPPASNANAIRKISVDDVRETPAKSAALTGVTALQSSDIFKLVRGGTTFMKVTYAVMVNDLRSAIGGVTTPAQVNALPEQTSLSASAVLQVVVSGAFNKINLQNFASSVAALLNVQTPATAASINALTATTPLDTDAVRVAQSGGNFGKVTLGVLKPYFRLDILQNLPSQIAQGVIREFFVSGELDVLRSMLPQGAGNAISSIVLSDAFTPVRARVALGEEGISGTLEVDVTAQTDVGHEIVSIQSQYTSDVSATAKFPNLTGTGITRSVGDASFISVAYSLTAFTITRIAVVEPGNATGERTIGTVTTVNRMFVKFNRTTAMPDEYTAGDYVIIGGTSAAANNGTFQILEVDYLGVNGSLLLANPNCEDALAGGSGNLQLFTFNSSTALNAEFVAGENVIISGFTGNNVGLNGTHVISAVNDGGNNLKAKIQGGSSSSLTTGRASCTRIRYSGTGSISTDAFVAGESIVITGASNAANNGTFVIARLETNVVIISNSAAVANSGATFTIASQRLVYSDTSNPATNNILPLGDDAIAISDGPSTNAANVWGDNAGGRVKPVVGRNVTGFGGHNVVFYVPNGVADTTADVRIHSAKAQLNLSANYSSIYTANQSLIKLNGIGADGSANEDNRVTIDKLYTVTEVNRLGLLNVIISIPWRELHSGIKQSAGVIASVESSVFATRPTFAVDTTETSRYNIVREAGISNAISHPRGTKMNLNIYQLPENARDIRVYIE